MDGPVSRSGRRLCARINYPLPLIDCQCLCVWKPPSGPDVNNCRNSGCGERQDRTKGQNIDHLDIMSKAAYRGGKRGAFLFIYFLFIQPVLLFWCLIIPSCCTPLKQEMSESSQDPAVCKWWHLFSSLTHKVQFRREINWVWFQGSQSLAGRFV